MKLIALLAACTALALAPTMASAQTAPPSPAGDWHGTTLAGERQTRSAVHIERSADGRLIGDIDLPDSGQWNMPLEDVSYREGVLSFAYRGGTRRFEGRWDADASAWTGQLHAPGGARAISYRAGLLGLSVDRALDGRWEGAPPGGGPGARIIVRVATNEHGTYGLMDLPHALETGIPVTILPAPEGQVAFAVPALGVRFEGRRDPAGNGLNGVFGAPGSDMPLVLARNDAGAPRRPQLPQAPLPYREEAVTIPAGNGRHPVALLLSGTGPQDRDESLSGHKPLLVLADHLTRRGTAVLRCDDRGVGHSTGEFRTSSLEDFASDARTALATLRARPEIDAAKIGLIGHSEGGIVASMVAAGRSDVAFVIQFAGPGVPVHALLVSQGEEVSRAQGMAETVIAQQSTMRRAMFDAMRNAATPQAALAAVEAFLVAQGMPPASARIQAAEAARPDILRIVNADPVPLLARINAPVLAIVGSKDVQVPATQNIPALRAALARNRDATVRALPDLNHLFQTATTGAPAEYYDIEETMAPLALDTISAWLAERGFGGPAAPRRNRRR